MLVKKETKLRTIITLAARVGRIISIYRFTLYEFFGVEIMSVYDSALPFISDDEFLNIGNTSQDAMLDGDLPNAEEPPKWIKVGRRARIIITQVSSPYKFWFLTTAAMIELKEMMKSLGLIYRQCDVKEFMIPKDCLKVGLICAAIYQDYWHRAKIVDIVDDSEVTVYYVDYGTTASLPSYDLLYLHKNFSDYPAQAMRGCLDLVRPTGGTWMYESCRYFASIISQRTIYAKITSLNESDQVHYLSLLQMPENGKMASIGEAMIEKDYAFPVDESINDCKERIYCEQYPSFEMLETGIYPSMQNIKKMKKKGFDFHLYEQSIITQ